MGVDCVKTSARTWQRISRSPNRRRTTQDRARTGTASNAAECNPTPGSPALRLEPGPVLDLHEFIAHRQHQKALSLRVGK